MKGKVHFRCQRQQKSHEVPSFVRPTYIRSALSVHQHIRQEFDTLS